MKLQLTKTKTIDLSFGGGGGLGIHDSPRACTSYVHAATNAANAATTSPIGFALYAALSNH